MPLPPMWYERNINKPIVLDNNLTIDLLLRIMVIALDNCLLLSKVIFVDDTNKLGQFMSFYKQCPKEFEKEEKHHEVSYSWSPQRQCFFS